MLVWATTETQTNINQSVQTEIGVIMQLPLQIALPSGIGLVIGAVSP